MKRRRFIAAALAGGYRRPVGNFLIFHRVGTDKIEVKLLARIAR
jgi:hypothetical protein